MAGEAGGDMALLQESLTSAQAQIKSLCVLEYPFSTPLPPYRRVLKGTNTAVVLVQVGRAGEGGQGQGGAGGAHVRTSRHVVRMS